MCHAFVQSSNFWWVLYRIDEDLAGEARSAGCPHCGGALRARSSTCSSEPDAMTHPDGMLIRITRQELGRIVGCSREMVGRVLKDLKEDHLISVSGKSIVVFGTR